MAAETDSKTNHRPRWVRVSAVAALAVVLLVCLLLVLLFTVDLGRFKGSIETTVSRLLDREFRTDGSLSITVGQTVDLSANDVYLAGAEWEDGLPMLTAKRVKATIRTASLLWGPIRFDDIEIEGLRLRLVSKADGEANWNVGPAEKAGKDDPPGRRPVEPPVLIERIDVDDAVVNLANPDADLEIVIRAIEHAVRDERLATRISGSVNDVPLAFEGDIGPRAHMHQGGDVTFAYGGRLGEIDFDASGLVDDLVEPRRPTVELDLRGPNVEYLFDVLGVEHFTTGPLDVGIDLVRADGKTELAIEGQVGEFRIGADGYASDLRELEEARLSVTAEGPNIDHLGEFVGFDRLPQAAFSMNGRIGKSGTEFTLEDIEIRVGDALFELEGRMNGFPRSSSADVALNVRGSDIAEFRELLGVPGALSGPFDLTARLQAPVGSGELVELDGRIKDIALDVDLFPSREADFVGSRATFEIVVPSFSTIGDAAGIEGLPALPFRLSGSADYRGDRVSVQGLSATLAGARADANGVVDLAFPGSLTNLDIHFVTEDLSALFSAFGIDGGPAVEVDYRSRLSIRNDNLFVSGIESRVGRGTLSGATTIALDPFASMVDFGLQARDVSLQDIVPASDVFSPADLPFAARVDGRYSGDQLTLRRSDIEIGDAGMEINGVIDLPPNTTATALTLFAEIPSLASLGSSDIFTLPDAPLTVTSRLDGQADTISARDVRMAIGDNVVEADFSYAGQDRPAFDVRLTAPVLDLRSFLTPPAEAIESPAPAGKRDRVIPDVVFPVDSLDTADVDVDVDIGTLITHIAAYRDVVLDATVEDGALAIDRASVLGRRGRTYGEMTYAADAQGWLFDADIKGEGLVIASLRETDETLRARPAFDLDAAFTGRGDNLRDLLATLDGRVLMHSGSGVVPKGSSRLMNLFFGDFGLELLDAVNPLAKSADELSLECAVLMLGIEDGVVSGNPALVMQLQALRIFAKVNIDLETEVLDMDFNTQQRRGIGISVSDLINPYTKVGGTLASPTIRLDETGAIVEGGAAVATGGLSVIAKALHNRFLSDPDPCGTALESYRKAVETAED